MKVAVRVRPLHPVTELGHEHVITTFDRQISVKSGIHHDLKTSFDKIMDESSQEEVFDQIVRPIIPQFLNGYNCTVFTYGQTGSGKTYTMFGGQAAEAPYRKQDSMTTSKSKIRPRNRFTEDTPMALPKQGQDRKEAPEMGQFTQRVLTDLAQHKDRGIIPRALQDVFENLQANTTVVCSFIQVYNEKIYDMLAEKDIG